MMYVDGHWQGQPPRPLSRSPRAWLKAALLAPVWLVGVSLIVAAGVPWLFTGPDVGLWWRQIGLGWIADLGLWWTVPVFFAGAGIAWWSGRRILDLVEF